MGSNYSCLYFNFFTLEIKDESREQNKRKKDIPEISDDLTLYAVWI